MMVVFRDLTSILVGCAVCCLITNKKDAAHIQAFAFCNMNLTSLRLSLVVRKPALNLRIRFSLHMIIV